MDTRLPENIIDRFESALLALNRVVARHIILDEMGGDLPIDRAEQIVGPALERIGRGWELGQVALSQVYMGGRICEEIINSILPPDAPDRKSQPKIAIAVLEDYHLLGKRIVYSILRASGYELLDYGFGINAIDLAHRAQQEGVKILLISTLMLPSALRVRTVRETLERAGDPPRIVVGGAPFIFDSQLWQEVGADAMGRNASDAVRIVSDMVEGRL